MNSNRAPSKRATRSPAVPFRLPASRHAANRQARHEERDQAVEQETLALVSFANVGPDKGQDKDRGHAVQIVHGRHRSATEDHQAEPSQDLHDNQPLPDEERAGEASGERAAPEVAQESPESGDEHKEKHGDRKTVMKHEQRSQGDLLRLLGSHDQRRVDGIRRSTRRAA